MLCVLTRIMSTHIIAFSILKKKITLNYPKSASKGFKNEFKIAVINDPSGFKPLKFYWNLKSLALASTKTFTLNRNRSDNIFALNAKRNLIT